MKSIFSSGIFSSLILPYLNEDIDSIVHLFRKKIPNNFPVKLNSEICGDFICLVTKMESVDLYKSSLYKYPFLHNHKMDKNWMLNKSKNTKMVSDYGDDFFYTLSINKPIYIDFAMKNLTSLHIRDGLIKSMDLSVSNCIETISFIGCIIEEPIITNELLDIRLEGCVSTCDVFRAVSCNNLFLKNNSIKYDWLKNGTYFRIDVINSEEVIYSEDSIRCEYSIEKNIENVVKYISSVECMYLDFGEDTSIKSLKCISHLDTLEEVEIRVCDWSLELIQEVYSTVEVPERFNRAIDDENIYFESENTSFKEVIDFVIDNRLDIEKTSYNFCLERREMYTSLYGRWYREEEYSVVNYGH